MFAKAPVPGQVKTRTELPPEDAAALHVAMVRNTLVGLRDLKDADVELSTDVPTGAWTDVAAMCSLQAPGDLGERILAALRTALEAGRPKAMILGGDSPMLPPDHIRSLLASYADVTLGPTEDGGYYAIACSRVSPAMFEGVRWSTEHAYSDTVAAIARCGLTSERGLPWFDVDRPEDLDRPGVRAMIGPLASIVIPTLNEAACIQATIAALMAIHGNKEIIVADGGSEDDTVARATACGARVVRCDRGRGSQMRAAAEVCRGDVLWFVHADTLPPPDALAAIHSALADARNVGGNFSLKFAGGSRAARNLTWIYPRLRFLGLSYGDASIFVRRPVYEQIGGCRPYPLFEDLDLIQRLKRRGRFTRLDCTIVTSARRFEKRYLRSWAVWIALQLLYWMGVPPVALARLYRHVR